MDLNLVASLLNGKRDQNSVSNEQLETVNLLMNPICHGSLMAPEAFSGGSFFLHGSDAKMWIMINPKSDCPSVRDLASTQAENVESLHRVHEYTERHLSHVVVSRSGQFSVVMYRSSLLEWLCICRGIESGEAPRAIQKASCRRVKSHGEDVENSLQPVSVLDLFCGFVDRKCESCGAVKVKACASCRMVFYCSKSCQVASWPVHKKYCKTLKDPHAVFFRGAAEAKEWFELVSIIKKWGEVPKISSELLTGTPEAMEWYQDEVKRFGGTFDDVGSKEELLGPNLLN